MQRVTLATAGAAIALLAAGCAGGHHGTTGASATAVGPSGPTGLAQAPHLLPRWLTTIIGRENKRFHARLAHGYPGNGSLVTHTNGDVVVGLSGSFTSATHPPSRGNFLRLVIASRTHRVERATLTRLIDPFVVARQSSGYLRVFPSRPGETRCRIPRGGPAPGAMLAARCRTEYASATRQSAAAGAVRIVFGERWAPGSANHAEWIVTVRYRDGKILGTRIEGTPPQLWR